jgi:triacylglycerol lipase
VRNEIRRFSAYLSAARTHLLDERGMRERLADRLGHLDCAEGCDDTVPVVLVHGYLARKSCWLPTIERLHRDGLTHLRAATYNVFEDGVEHAARRVYDKVQRVAEEHDTERVHVVAHSMGGVATLYAASRYGLADQLASVVTLGSPYGGAPLARFLPPWIQATRTARQLAPGSELLSELHREAHDLDVSWTSLWSRRDELVPVDAAQLSTATNTETAPVGHVEMLLSRRVAAEVVRTLRTATPHPAGAPRPAA